MPGSHNSGCRSATFCWRCLPRVSQFLDRILQIESNEGLAFDNIAQCYSPFSDDPRKWGCVVNLPTADMVDTVSLTGNGDRDSVDKFSEFGLTKTKSSDVVAVGMDSRNFFIFEIVKASFAKRPTHQKTCTISAAALL